ncbi:O-antigen ligase family protein [Pirellulaceae bacterium SH449]
MHCNTTQTDSSDSQLVQTRWLLVFFISVWVASSIAMASLRWDWSVEALLQQFDYDFKDNRLEEQREGLNKWLIIGYSTLALLGLCGVIRDRGRTISKLDIALLVPFALWGWCCLSIFWSVEPSLSVRRIAHLVMAVMGGLGISLFLRQREIAWSILFAMSYLVIAGLCAEFYYGTFVPWRSYYRFSGVGHSNETALFCAVVILAGRMLLLLDPIHKAEKIVSYRYLIVAIIIVALFFLLLTKSRTTLLSLMAALLFTQIAVSRSVGAWILLTGLVSFGSFMGLVIASLPSSVASTFFGVATVGRSDHVASLTGRLPLWGEILKHMEHHPVTGFGYGAYWTTKRVEDFAQMFHWEPPNGHSIYIDALVETGPIGCGLMVLALAATFLIGLNYYRRSGNVAALFSVALVCLATVHGVAESTFFKGCVGPLLLSTAVFFLWQNRVRGALEATSPVQHREKPIHKARFSSLRTR